MTSNMKHMESMPISMKNITFKSLYKLIDQLKRENNADYQVLLLTANSTLVGDIMPCVQENEMIKYSDDPAKFALDISALFDILRKEWHTSSEAESAYSDGHFINLVNVTLYKLGSNEELMKVDQLIVYLDQIIGFSLIPRKW